MSSQRFHPLKRSQRNPKIILLGLSLLTLFLFALNLKIGPIAIPVKTLLSICLAPFGLHLTPYTIAQFQIIWQLRMLNTVDITLAGFALGLSGAVMQGLLRNPLADPALLGVSSGAGFIVVLWVTILGTAFSSTWMIPLSACAGSILVFALILLLSERFAKGFPLSLLLTGIALNAFFGAATLLLLSRLSAPLLQSVFFWTLGGITGINWSVTGDSAIALTVGVSILLCQSKALNVLTLGEAHAETLGVSLPRLRILSLLGVSLSVGASIALVGPIAFVGLLVPHLCRRWCSPNHRLLLPAALLGGACLLLLGASITHQHATETVPLGVFTALLGAPFFLSLLWFRRL